MMLFSYAKALLWLLLVTAVAPMHAQWSMPTDITEQGVNSESPGIEVDPQGNIHAIWIRTVGSNKIIQTSSKSLVGGWNAPETLTEEIEFIDSPIIKSDSQGNLIAIWIGSNGSNHIIQCSMKPSGGSWDAPFNLSDDGQDAYNHAIAIDHLGNITTVWQRSNGLNMIIQSKAKPFGGNWENTKNLSVADKNAYNPQITCDPVGNVFTAWLESTDNNTYVVQVSNKLFGEESWSTSITISEPEERAFFPRIESDNQGNLTAAWESSNGTTHVIRASIKPYNGGWGISEDVSTAGINAYNPEIAIDHLGNITIAWTLEIGSEYIAQSRRKLFNGSWEDIINLSEPGKIAFDPRVKADLQGNITAIWSGYNDNTGCIQSSNRFFGGNWNAPYTLTEPGYSSQNPSFALDTHGNAYAVWMSFKETNNIIQFAKNIQAPTVTSITPHRGPLTGGNEITITGANFIDVVSVFFGAHEAQIVSHSPTSITAIVPEGTGEVDVIVFTSYGSSSPTSASRYSYVSSEILPPSHFRGKRKEHQFLTQSEYYDSLSWSASPDSNVSRYVLYRDDKPVKTFGGNRASYSCKVRNQRANKKSSYRLIAENEQGERSEALAITVR